MTILNKPFVSLKQKMKMSDENQLPFNIIYFSYCFFLLH